LEKGDVTDKERFREICLKHKITQIYHMAAILSATGEKDPELCWNVNLISYKNIFDIAVDLKINKVFCASSMAVFGPTTPKENTPQHCSIEPTTMYGITKYAG
jgi:nucleoside-diphosphate-sugar epimerase